MADSSSYEALARRWRPQTFADVLAQDQVTRTLQNAITGDRIHHAYLFCGPRGTGKTTTARILAKALNCEQGPTPTPCNECISCVGITRGSSIDVLEIDAASNTGVDDVRELRESSRYVPAGARFKIYIIDEVHRLSPSAFDALLKTLEEPPPTVKFIFATTEPQKVPATVRSRALRFDFRLVSHEVLRGHIQRIAKAEGIAIDTESVDILAAQAAGSFRDSQSLLEQIASYADGAITAETTNEALGLVGTEALFRFTESCAGRDVAGALALITDISRAGRDFVLFVQQLNEHLKRLLFARALGDAYVDDSLSDDALARYRETAGGFDENDLVRLLLMSLETGKSVRRAAQPRLEMEMFAMRAAKMDRSIDVRSLVERLENGLPGGDLFSGNRPGGIPSSQSAATPAPNPAPPEPVRGTLRRNPESCGPARPGIGDSLGAAPRPDRSAPSPQEPTAGTKSPEAAPELQPEEPSSSANGRIDFAPILDAICEKRPTLRAILGSAVLSRTGPGKVELDAYNGSPFHSRQLSQKPIRDLIHAEIAKALGAGIRVSIHVKRGKIPAPAGNEAGIASAARPTAPASGTNAEIDADHNLQEIIRRFDGEIVD